MQPRDQKMSTLVLFVEGQCSFTLFSYWPVQLQCHGIHRFTGETVDLYTPILFLNYGLKKTKKKQKTKRKSVITMTALFVRHYDILTS